MSWLDFFSGDEKFKTLYKNYRGDTWNVAYEGESENVALGEAERRIDEGAYAARVVDGSNNTIASF